MAAIAFDTLRFTKRLREAGVPDKQAEAEAEAVQEALREIIGDFENTRLSEVSTKLDIKELDAKIDITRRDIKEVDAKIEATRRDIKEVDAKIEATRREIKELEARIEATRLEIKELEARIEATRLDIKELDAKIERTRLDVKELDAKVETTRDFLRRDIKESELRLEARIAESNASLVKWVVSAGLIQIALISALLLVRVKGG